MSDGEIEIECVSVCVCARTCVQFVEVCAHTRVCGSEFGIVPAGLYVWQRMCVGQCEQMAARERACGCVHACGSARAAQ